MESIFYRKCGVLSVLAALCSLVAISCATSSSVGGYSTRDDAEQFNTQSDFPARQNHATQSGAASQNTTGPITTAASVAGSESLGSGTELWLFGPIASPELCTPLGAKGVRSIIDLRHLPVDQAGRALKTYADRGLGLALCLRWRNPSSGKTKVENKKNYDVPPTQEEADHAISKLTEMFGSEDAKRIGDRLFVQFYNEVGGGPGTFPPNDADELLAFATRAAAEIRKVNSQLRICGPAVTGGQLQPRQSTGSSKMKGKAEVIEKAISWSAEHADVIDLHLHGVDGSWSRPALEKLRGSLDQTSRGKTVRIVSFEWSCARFPDRENDAAVRNAIRGIWKTLNDFDLICAAYGPYWPLKNKANEKVADRFGWVSIVDSEGQRNPPIYETLQEIGGGNGIDEPKSKRGKRGKRSKKRGN